MGGSSRLHVDFDALGAFPREEIDRALAVTGRESQRRRKLPAYQMMYYAIALGLMTSVGAREVLRRLLQRGSSDRVFLPATEAAITKARQRLGYEPLRELLEQVAKPIATRGLKSAWFKGRRLVALDGSTFNVIDSRANVRAFGKPTSSRGETVFAQIRWAVLAEVGTHAVFAAEMDGWRTSESRLAGRLFKHLRPGMLCVADRGFYGFEAWNKAAETGADLLWRVQKAIPLPRLRTLNDRSYLSEIRPRSSERRAIRERRIPVRVIEFDATIGSRHEHYRLITTLLDPRQATAMELAKTYAKRWQIETIFDEIKSNRRQGTAVLRSKLPSLVRQDFYGLLLAHFGVRSIMLEAAREQSAEPNELSFKHALDVVIRRLPDMVSFSPSAKEALP